MVNNKENYKFDLGVEGLTNERGPENEHQKKKKESIIVRVIVFPGCKCWLISFKGICQFHKSRKGHNKRC